MRAACWRFISATPEDTNRTGLKHVEVPGCIVAVAIAQIGW